MLIIILAFAAVSIIKLAPQTAAGRTLFHVLVEWPARQLSRITRGHLILAALIAVLIFAAIAIAKTEGGFLVAQGLPEGMGILVSLDVASYVDAIAVALLFAASVRLKAVKAMVMTTVARVRRRVVGRTGRSRRIRRPRPGLPPANDDEPAALPLAA